jgi:nitrate/nitrite transport system substrate-binding protein
MKMDGDSLRTQPIATKAASRLTRRQFVSSSIAATALSLLYAGLPARWSGAVYASDTPEKEDLRFGIVAIASCSPIVIAHEKGFFKKYGIRSTLSMENGWAAARDKLISGENQASHFKYSQGLASNLGVSGAPKIPMISPWTLARNGSAFLVSLRVQEKPTRDPKTWVPLVQNAKKAGAPLTIALPLLAGFHGMLYRYFLATAGVDPDKDCRFIVLPPAQMVQNMRVGAMSACAMVEPWGTRGVQEKVAYIAFYGNDLWPEHPVKACTFLEKFGEQNPKTVLAVLRALHEASIYCDDMGNRPELAKILSVTNYLNTPVNSLLPSLLGKYDYGDGKIVDDPRHVIRFHKDNSNYPQPKEMAWFVTQFRRWGLIQGMPDYQAVCRQVCRPDIYEEAMKGIDFSAYKQDDSPIAFFDGKSFNPSSAEKYANSFAINSLKN